MCPGLAWMRGTRAIYSVKAHMHYLCIVSWNAPLYPASMTLRSNSLEPKLKQQTGESSHDLQTMYFSQQYSGVP